MEKNSNHLAPAAVITWIGVALLAVFSFLGRYLKDGDMGMAVIWSLAFVAVMVGLVYFARYAKRRDSDLLMWRIVEGVTVVAYLAVAVVASMPVLRFLGVNSYRAEVKEVALNDIAHMRATLEDFRETENAAVIATLRGMQSARSGDCTTDLIKFMNEYSVAGYQDAMEGKISDFYQPLTDQLNNAATVVEAWKMIQLPAAVSLLAQLDSTLPQQLNEASLSLAEDHPLIENDGSSFSLRKYKPTAYGKIGVGVVSLIKGDFRIGVVSIVIVVLFVLMVAFRYLFAPRSRRQAIRSGAVAEDGGIMLG